MSERKSGVLMEDALCVGTGWPGRAGPGTPLIAQTTVHVLATDRLADFVLSILTVTGADAAWRRPATARMG